MWSSSTLGMHWCYKAGTPGGENAQYVLTLQHTASSGRLLYNMPQVFKTLGPKTFKVLSQNQNYTYAKLSLNRHLVFKSPSNETGGFCCIDNENEKIKLHVKNHGNFLKWHLPFSE